MNTTPAQQAFILCSPDRKTLQALIDELEKQLAEQSATILLYGITLKRREGFVVVEAAQGITRDVARWLQDRPDIVECVVYNVPSLQQEQEAEAEARSLHPKAAPPEIPPAVRLAIQELEQWLTEHHYRIIPDEDTNGLRLVPDNEEQAAPEEENKGGAKWPDTTITIL